MNLKKHIYNDWCNGTRTPFSMIPTSSSPFSGKKGKRIQPKRKQLIVNLRPVRKKKCSDKAVVVERVVTRVGKVKVLIKKEGYSIYCSEVWDIDDINAPVCMEELKFLEKHAYNYPKYKKEKKFTEERLMKLLKLNGIHGQRMMRNEVTRRKEIFYMCTWRGYPKEFYTWEPEWVIEKFPGKARRYFNEKRRLEKNTGVCCRCKEVKKLEFCKKCFE